jgi:predicted porin
MKPCRLAVLVLSVYAAGARAEPTVIYSGVPDKPASYLLGIDQIDVSSLIEPGSLESATRIFAYPGKRMGLDDMVSSRTGGVAEVVADHRRHRGWGISVGFERGPLGLRLAHQNKSAMRLSTIIPVGKRLEAKNSTAALSLDVGVAKIYTAYSANRGWGSSPLWNPDNPYGAMITATPSTDSRDVVLGMAVPAGRRVTFLTSFVHKDDRDEGNLDANQFALGGTYALSRRTDFYAAWTSTRFHSATGASLRELEKGSSALNVGMRHAF